MDIKFCKKPKSDCVEIRFVTKQKEIAPALKEIGFSVEKNSIFFDIYDEVLYVGLVSLECEEIKIAAAKAIQYLIETSYTACTVILSLYTQTFSYEAMLEGMHLGAYSFTKYKSEKKCRLMTLWLCYDRTEYKKEELQSSADRIEVICQSVNMVRDIVNTPPHDYTPQKLAEDAAKIAEEEGLECEIYDEKALDAMGMQALLAVSRASVHAPRLIHLSYTPKDAVKKVLIVGKGLTYDSGGLSLKPAESMVSMKCDKAGAAAVLGVMKALKGTGISCEVHGFIGAVENMIGGDAYKPDDVLVAKNGVTIEIKNTDAEGRLVLADVLCYAQESVEKFDYIFDLATLTGASIVAMGNHTSAVMGHSESLKRKIQKAADESGELIGFLPFNRYFADTLKSEIADIVNTAPTRSGSAITATLFLDHFIEEKNKKKWLHFDIAGPSFVHKAWGYNPYGASGVGVRMLLSFLNQCQ